METQKKAVNPQSKQILQYDNLGNVTGAYTNPAYEEWEKLNLEKVKKNEIKT